jgi:tetratricopeptide (TPR) repeat protein
VSGPSALSQAVEHHKAGRLAEAEAAYSELLREQPANSDALHLLGLISHQRGDHARALDLMTAAVHASPQNTPAWFNLGAVYDALGDTSGAIEAYERVVAASPANVDAHVNLGNAYGKSGLFDAAARAYDRALELYPAHPLALANKGAMLVRSGRSAEGAGLLQESAGDTRDVGVAGLNLANALLQAGRYGEALEACASVLASKDGAETRLVLAQTLSELGRLDDSRTELERALVFDPESADVLTNLGIWYYVSGDAKQAVAYCEAAVRKNPKHERAHFNLAISYLLDQRWTEGWSEFEWRKRDRVRAADFAYERVPAWDGSRFYAKRLLISSEQGLGDMIFVARYLPMVAALGGETILETWPELMALMGRIPAITPYDRSRGPYPAQGIDLQCPAFSLPRVFGTVETTIPNTVPYLRADDALVTRWQERLQIRPDTFNVGVVWGGSNQHRLDRFRSCRMADFEPLGAIEGVRWFALQKGPREHDAVDPSPDFQPERLGAVIGDLDDTAAIAMCMDLVITVDTSVAHLAGALAVPVWTLLGLGTDWRWMTGRTDTPWYPTMRLFRQTVPGDWRVVMDDVAEALRVRLAERSNVACKICRGATAYIGAVDFNKSCAEQTGTFLQPSGIAVPYRRCSVCEFVFTTFCDAWTPDQFAQRIYNSDYATVDPDYGDARPRGNANVIARTFDAWKATLAVLDYGSGSGVLAAHLAEGGFEATASYDPYSNPDASVLARRYDIVTCFEVLEHHPDPVAAIREIAGVLNPDGIVVLSTLVQGADFEREGLQWWYVGPRNGHVSIFSRTALATAWGAFGFQVGSMNDDLHVAFRNVPDFAKSLFSKV